MQSSNNQTGVETISSTVPASHMNDSTDQTMTAMDSLDTDSGIFVHVMAGVGGGVVIIILLVMVIFIVKSRRQRRRNVDLYRRQAEFVVSSSVELTDTAQQDYSRNINGVHQSLYGEDSILPITVRTPETVSRTKIQTNQSRPPEHVENYAYENNINLPIRSSERNPMELSSSTHQECQSISGQHGNVAEQTKPAAYETIFPVVPGDVSAPPGSSSDVRPHQKHHQQQQQQQQPHSLLIRGTNDNKQSGKVNIKHKRGAVLKEHDTKTSSASPKNKNRSPTKKLSVSKTGKNSEVGHEPAIKEQNKTNVLAGGEVHDYENDLYKLKRAQFKDAKLLKAVPPACHVRHYVNVPDEEDDKMAFEQSRQSSVYENPDVINDLKVSDTAGYVNVPVTDGKVKSTNKTVANEHQNSETSKKLQLAFKAKVKGDPTRITTSRLSTAQALDLADARASKEEMYLDMESDITEDLPYLSMNSPPADDASVYYTKMSPSYSFTKRKNAIDNKCLDFPVSRRIGQRSSDTPPPCGGGIYKEYNNYAKPPVKYVNFFRSRSTDEVYTYADPKCFSELSKKSDQTEKQPISKRSTNHN